MFYNLIRVQITHISYYNYIFGYLFKRKNSVLLSYNNNLHIEQLFPICSLFKKKINGLLK